MNPHVGESQLIVRLSDTRLYGSLLSLLYYRVISGRSRKLISMAKLQKNKLITCPHRFLTQWRF